MGVLDSLKGMFSGKKGAENRAQAQKVAQRIDGQAAKSATRQGAVGNIAKKTHEVIDKVDGD